MKTLAEAASLQPGFVSSALGPSRTRRLGYLSLPMLLAPLGLRLGLIEAPELAARYVREMEKSNSNQARPGNLGARCGSRTIARVLRYLAGLSWNEAQATLAEARAAAAAEAAQKAAVAEQDAKVAKTNGAGAGKGRGANGTANVSL
jgi:hypothetical protein